MTQIQDIITLIGKKRFIYLGVAIIVAVILIGLWQQVILPASEEIERESQTIASERARLQRELTDIPVRYKTLRDNEYRYEALMQGSFISSQDRISARRRLEGIRLRSGMQDVSYSIAPIEVMAEQSTQGIDGDFVRSKISVTMKGIDDLEMRDFIDLMRQDFGGLVILRSAEFKQENQLTAENLQKLSRGEKIDFVSGKADLEWYSVIPAAEASEQDAGGLPQ